MTKPLAVIGKKQNGKKRKQWWKGSKPDKGFNVHKTSLSPYCVKI
jgi:hypothetical protein